MAGLKDALMAQITAKGQQMVAAGQINQSQMDMELQRLSSMEPDAIKQQYPEFAGVQAPPGTEGSTVSGPATVPGPVTPSTTLPNIGVNNEMPLNTGQEVINAGFNVGRLGTTAGNILTNPNQVSQFGSQFTTVDPLTGQPKVEQVLSEPNQQVVGGIQGNAVSANQALGGILGGGVFGSLTNGGAGVPQSNYENAIYNQLTRGQDEQKAREKEQLDQTLANRGIPVGSKAYSTAMADLDTRYDKIFSGARNQAVTGANSQALSASQVLSGLGGQGFMQPNFQGFQSVGYQQPNAEQVFGQVQSNALSNRQITSQEEMLQKQLDQQWKLANLKPSGGGGGGGSSSSGGGTSPFRDRPPGS